MFSSPRLKAPAGLARGMVIAIVTGIRLLPIPNLYGDHHMTRPLLACIALVLLIIAGCGETRYIKPATSGAISAPPAGKSLVNVHRPSTAYGYGAEYIVWDQHDIIGNTAGGDWFQYTCDPGEHVFIGRQSNVSVIKANLAADKIYDIVIDCGPNFVPFQANHRLWLKEVTKGSERHDKWKSWQATSTLLTLDPAQAEAREAFEAKEKEDIDQILADFIGGPKQDKIGVISPDDSR